MNRHDWLPSLRGERLAMAKNWIRYIESKKTLFGIPDNTMSVFIEVVKYFDELCAIPKTSRTIGINAEIREIENKLSFIMRDIKKRYFFVPPLNNCDIVELGLKPKNKSITNIPAPIQRVDAELSSPGIGLVELRNIHAVGESSDARSDNGVRIYYGMLCNPDERCRFAIFSPPDTGEDLPHSVFTRRKRYKFDFVAYSGKRVFFCMRYENSKGQVGPWGDILHIFVS